MVIGGGFLLFEVETFQGFPLFRWKPPGKFPYLGQLCGPYVMAIFGHFCQKNAYFLRFWSCLTEARTQPFMTIWQPACLSRHDLLILCLKLIFEKVQSTFLGPRKSKNGHFWPILAKNGGVHKIAIFDFFEKQKNKSLYFSEFSWMNVCLPRTDLRGVRTENVNNIFTPPIDTNDCHFAPLRYPILKNSVTAVLVSI